MPKLSPSTLAAAQATGLLLLVLLCLFVLYRGTLATMAGIWLRSQTFAHGLLIPPMSAWLVWRQRKALAGVALAPAPLALVPLAACGAVWLLASLAKVQVAEQLALVAMIPCLVAAAFGGALVRRIAFPLLFLFFAVPCGEFLIAPLSEFTARFTVGALQLVGVPVYRDGNTFSLPTGNWSVEAACSGLRYLIATSALGSVYAYLMFDTASRRLSFMVAAIVVPVLANGLRACLIVLLGHWSNMRLAAGVDHVIYGWLFFTIVLGLLFWVGARWRRAPVPAAAAPAQGQRLPTSALAACMIAVLPWPLLASQLETEASVPTAAIELAPLPGWQVVPVASSPWLRRHAGAQATAVGGYARATKVVTLQTALYHGQHPGTGLLEWSNSISAWLGPDWRLAQDSARQLHLRGRSLPVRQVVLQSANGKVLLWYWYRQGGVESNWPLEIKLRLAWARLWRRSDAGMEISVSTPFDEDARDAALVLTDFLDDAYPLLPTGASDAASH